jgi:hypothetical protein
VKLANKIADINKRILEDLKNPLRREGLQGRPIEGSEWVPEDEHYLWRKFSHDKVRGAIARFGQNKVELMIRNAMRSAMPDLEEAYLDKLAHGYLMNVRTRAAGLGNEMGDAWSLTLSREDWHKFKAILKDETGAAMTDEEADAIIARLGKRRDEGAMTNLKRRTPLDEMWVERDLPTVDGAVADLSFRDLLETNANNTFAHYVRRAAGRIALGRVRVSTPKGVPIINGITDDEQIAKILNMVQNHGLDRGQSPVEAAKSVERLKFAFDRIRGIPDPNQQGDLAQWLRLTRSYMSTRLMGQVGIAQIGETGSAVGVLGWRSAFQHMPGFRRIVDAAGDIRNSNPLFEELEAMGIGVERLHGLFFHNLDEVGELPFAVDAKPRMERALNNARLAENLTYELSGMSIIQQRQEMWVAANMAQKIANIGAKLKAGKGIGRGDKRRLAQLGIDEEMLGRVADQLRTHADTTEGAFFGRKLNRINGSKWTDLEAKAALENALFRATKKIIQSGDEGSAAVWMSNPIAQTIFQFRGFGFTAWANQFQYNIHMGDPAALATFATSVAWSAAVRAAQINILAATRSDGEEFKEKHLTAWELGKSGFQRAGWSSIMPMIADTGLALAGQPGAFNARTSGQASDMVFGSASFTFIDSAAKGIGGMVNSVADGRDPSQAEVRALVGLAPLSNLLPISVGLSSLISDLPERAPRRRLED